MDRHGEIIREGLIIMPRGANIILNDEELALKEEEQNLSGIESSIDSVISSNSARIDEIDSQLSDFYVFDKDDLENKQYLQESLNSLKNKADQWRSYKDSPYFGHMDLVCNDSKTEVFFIGKKGIGDGDKIYVLDWRTPIGTAFYNKQSTRYSIEGNEYRLILRRSVDIQRARVISVRSEFDDSLSLDGDIIDPFLISVLKDNRRNYRLADIIRTIQGNQNEIIRKPVEESFVVQGCAGSGKTMILLHRLSYIAFNNPKFDFSRCCVLTPNEFFNVHVDELSKELGLDRIKRYSVESFYASWIRFLGKSDTVTSGASGGKPRLKVEPVAEQVSSEKLLDSGMLEEIYSRQFYDGIISLFEARKEKVIRELDSCGISTILKDHARSVPDFAAPVFTVFRSLKQSLAEVSSAHSMAIKAYDKARAELESAERQIEKTDGQLALTKESLEKARSEFVIDLKNAEKEAADSVLNYQELRIEAEQKIGSAEKDKATVFNELKTVEDSLAIIRNNMPALKKLSFLRLSSLEIVLTIVDRCANEIHALEEAQDRYSRIAPYNFGKRSRARAEVAALERALSKAVDSVSEEYRTSRSAVPEELRRRIAELDTVIVEENQKLAGIIDSKSLEKKLLSIRSCKQQFDSETYPDIESTLPPATFRSLPDSYKSYITEFRNRSEKEKLRTAAELKAERNKSEIEKASNSIIQPGAIEILKKATALTEELDFSAFSSLMESELMAVYQKHGQKKRRGVSYRHDLLYKLLMCSLYYGTGTQDQYFMCIDEAQDLSVIEYALLRRILGPRTVFNLYGDVNQLVYSYKGITQWDEIAGEVTPNVCFLNENYRNTRQITDFCNKEFEADVFPIGLSGENVRRMSVSETVDELLAIHKKTPEMRIAVIYRRGLSGVRDALSVLQDNAVFDRVETSKISVITVEESKGLEFDAVAVIESQLSMNEKYISYTRALDNLIITELPGSVIKNEAVTPDDASVNDIQEEATEATERTEEKGETEEVPADQPLPPITGLSPSDMQEDDDLPDIELPDKPLNVRVAESAPYISAFFAVSPDSKNLFSQLADEISLITPDIMIRVSKEFIGLAKPGEKCRLYVSFIDGKPAIKYKHLYARETFVPEKKDQYLNTYKQCAAFVERYPETIISGQAWKN